MADSTVVRQRQPAKSDAYALIASSLGTGLLTFGFWTIVARTYGVVALGETSALVATVTFIGGASSLNLTTFLARYLPAAGRRGRHLVSRSYLAALAATTLSVSIVLGSPWTHSRAVEQVPPWAFWSLCAAMSIFLIQDGALLGAGRARWIPWENIGVAVVRIGLVLALTKVGGGGPIVAFGIGAALAVAAVSALLLGPVTAGMTGSSALPPRSTLVRFVSIEAATSALTFTHDTFLPALVTGLLGAAAGGYFYVPWLVVTTFALFIAQAMIAAVRTFVAHPEHGAQAIASQLRMIVALVAIGLAGCTIYPELPLSILGGDIAQHAAGVTRWFGLSLGGTALATTYWAICLIRGRAVPTFVVNLAKTVGTIGTLVVFAKHLDLTMLGAVYCAVQWVVGLATLPFLLRELTRLGLSAPVRREV